MEKDDLSDVQLKTEIDKFADAAQGDFRAGISLRTSIKHSFTLSSYGLHEPEEIRDEWKDRFEDEKKKFEKLRALALEHGMNDIVELTSAALIKAPLNIFGLRVLAKMELLYSLENYDDDNCSDIACMKSISLASRKTSKTSLTEDEMDRMDSEMIAKAKASKKSRAEVEIPRLKSEMKAELEAAKNSLAELEAKLSSLNYI